MGMKMQNFHYFVNMEARKYYRLLIYKKVGA